MSETASSAVKPTADQVLQALADKLGFDAVTALKATAGASAANVESNPTVTNAGVQAGLLLPSLIGTLPGMESDAIGGTAGAIRQLIDLIPMPTVTAPAAAG